MEGSVSLSVNFGGLCTGSYLHDTNMQIRFNFIFVPFVLCIVAVSMGMLMLKVAFPTVTVFIYGFLKALSLYVL